MTVKTGHTITWGSAALPVDAEHVKTLASQLSELVFERISGQPEFDATDCFSAALAAIYAAAKISAATEIIVAERMGRGSSVAGAMQVFTSNMEFCLNESLKIVADPEALKTPEAEA